MPHSVQDINSELMRLTLATNGKYSAHDLDRIRADLSFQRCRHAAQQNPHLLDATLADPTTNADLVQWAHMNPELFKALLSEPLQDSTITHQTLPVTIKLEEAHSADDSPPDGGWIRVTWPDQAKYTGYYQHAHPAPVFYYHANQVWHSTEAEFDDWVIQIFRLKEFGLEVVHYVRESAWQEERQIVLYRGKGQESEVATAAKPVRQADMMDEDSDDEMEEASTTVLDADAQGDTDDRPPPTPYDSWKQIQQDVRDGGQIKWRIKTVPKEVARQIEKAEREMRNVKLQEASRRDFGGYGQVQRATSDNWSMVNNRRHR